MHLGKLLLGLVGIWQGAKALGAALDDDKEPQPQPPDPKLSGKRHKVKVYKVSELKDKRSAKQRADILIPLVQKGRLDPQLREYVVKLLSQRCGQDWCVGEKNWRREVEVVFRALKERYRYIHDPVGVDHFSSAKKILEFGGGDCDEGVVLIASALGTVGYESRFVIIEVKYDGGDTGWHIYLEAKIPDRPAYWMPLDITVNKPPGWAAPAHMVKQRMVFPIP